MEEKTDSGKEKKFDYHSPCGDPILPVLQWDESGKNVVKVGERNLQKEIDELAKGMSIGEQIGRLLRGDTSVVKEGEPVYADVSGAPETDLEAAQQRVVFTSNVERLALANGCTVEELSQKLDDRKKAIDAEQAALLEKYKSLENEKKDISKVEVDK